MNNDNSDNLAGNINNEINLDITSKENDSSDIKNPFDMNDNITINNTSENEKNKDIKTNEKDTIVKDNPEIISTLDESIGKTLVSIILLYY